MSFLPTPYQHTYEVAQGYQKSVVYFSMEFAIDQALKTYSGGLGFLAGSHMRSACELGQNMLGIGILWTYGYYDQARDENREMAVAHRQKMYHFLKDTGLVYSIQVHGAEVWVKALYLPGEVFGTAPMFFLTTDIAENDHLSRTISHSLYASDKLTRISQNILLGVGGAKLLEVLNVVPEVWHLNEAHGLAACFYEAKKWGLDWVGERFVFTTHTPEEAGNEKSSFQTLRQFGYFSGLSDDVLGRVTDLEDDTFNHSLVALRVCRIANGVSKLHGEVARRMWSGYEGLCPIIHITNAQNKKFWEDRALAVCAEEGDIGGLGRRKRQLKEKLVKEVANQTGRIFDPDILTIVWARRFAGYKRPDLLLRDMAKFEAMLANSQYPVQLVWAGKPYPEDYAAVDTFNRLVRLSRSHSNVAVLVGYELALSRLLKGGADIWLNTPVVTREASGTSGMTAAMNGAINLSTQDGWICEFARGGENAFLIPTADLGLRDTERDDRDCEGFYELMQHVVLPSYYDAPESWMRMVVQSMEDVTPEFGSNRMAEEYYQKLYNVSK
ncbi:alpha-glucan family phosphorylase [Rubritalea tangerina]|uniref:Alpha-glucan family phosphorylase n=1 Tax=Rubritalea tangerina TaxID=430798 RepID=A0ABW4ZA98_9BACT